MPRKKRKSPSKATIARLQYWVFIIAIAGGVNALLGNPVPWAVRQIVAGIHEEAAPTKIVTEVPLVMGETPDPKTTAFLLELLEEKQKVKSQPVRFTRFPEP